MLFKHHKQASARFERNTQDAKEEVLTVSNLQYRFYILVEMDR